MALEENEVSTDNYNTPENPYAQEPSPITPAARADLRTLSGWLKFISSVTLTITILSVFQAIYLMVLASNAFGDSGAEYGVFYANFISYAINITLAIINFRAGIAYKRFVSSNNPYDLEAGFKAQRDYFMFFAIYIIFNVILFLIGLASMDNYGGMLNNYF